MGGENSVPILGIIGFLLTVDRGPGIPEEALPHLFERYWGAKPVSLTGSGLGLYIVQGVVQAHGGKVWVESRPGAGSSFFFTLPVAAG